MSRYIDAERFIEHERRSVEDDMFAEKVFEKNDEDVSLQAIVECLILDIENAPTADVAPVRHAHWIENEDYSLTCSACGHTTEEIVKETIGDGMYDGVYDVLDPYFCAKCGARMDEEVQK